MNIGDPVRTIEIQPIKIPVPERERKAPARTAPPIPRKAPERTPATPSRPRRTPTPTRTPSR